MPVALNVDGLERKRKKWNALAPLLVSRIRVAIDLDAQCYRLRCRTNPIYYRQHYGAESTFIPYGAEMGKVNSTATLKKLGLQPGEYFLYVSRMEPENNALLVRQAFEQTTTTKKLALIGDAPYADEYIARVRDTRDPRVVIPGGDLW